MVSATGVYRGIAAPVTDLGNLQDLPAELIIKCFNGLEPADLAATSLVNRQLYILSSDESLWRFLCRRDFPHQPIELPPKLNYQNCVNIRKGRYAVRDNFAPPGALLFPGNQKVQRFPFTTKAIVLPNQDGSFQSIPLPRDADLDNLYLEWNGNQLAVACYTYPTQSVQIFDIQNGQLQLRQALPMRCIGFLWQGRQLITASISASQVLIQIWNPDQFGNLQMQCSCTPPGSDWVILNTDLRVGDEYEFYYSLAWDGKWLAIAKRDQMSGNVYVWKETHGQLKVEKNLGLVNVHSLRWKGDLLFMEDEDDKICIWNRNGTTLCQELSCFGMNVQIGDEYEDITDIHIHGNQLFLAFGRTISLLETNKEGFYEKVYTSVHPFVSYALNFHRGALFVRSASLGDKVRMISFTAAYQEMLETLRNELILPFFEESSDFFGKMVSRLQRMPASQTQPILEELDQVLIKAGSPRFTEHTRNSSQLPCTPLQFSQAIDNYLQKRAPLLDK